MEPEAIENVDDRERQVPVVKRQKIYVSVETRPSIRGESSEHNCADQFAEFDAVRLASSQPSCSRCASRRK